MRGVAVLRSIVRSFEVVAREKEAWASSHLVRRGWQAADPVCRQIAEYIRYCRSIFSIVDASNGKRVLDYRSDSSLGAFACYSLGTFTFVSMTQDGQSVVRTASAP